MPLLPLDILESIINFLAEDNCLDDIRQCSLTTKSLVPICQRRLFASISLVQERDWELDEGTIQPHPIERFHALLSSHPRLASYVRQLEVGCMMNYDDDDRGGAFGVLDLLDQVHTLTFGFSDGNRDSGSLRAWKNNVPQGMSERVTSFVHRNPIRKLSLFGIEGLPAPFVQGCHSLQHLTVQYVLPEALSEPGSSSASAIKLKNVELLDETMDLTQKFILDPSPLLDLSGVKNLTLKFGMNDESHFFTHVLPLPNQLETLDLGLEKNIDEWSCQGNILSLLSPSSLKTLRTVKLSILAEGVNAPPFCGFTSELAEISGRNILEELDIEILFQYDSYPNMVDQALWKELDEVLSNGFSSLRKVRLRVDMGIFTAVEDAEIAQKKLETLLAENFDWCRKNVEFTAEAEAIII